MGRFWFHMPSYTFDTPILNEPVDGVMVNMLLTRLKEINEKNGIVFGDMILEELGGLTAGCCREFGSKDGRRIVAMRLDGDEFTVWMEDWSEAEAAVFVERLLDKIAASFEAEMFNVDVHVGMAAAQEDLTSEKLICMAKHAQSFVVPGVTKRYFSYNDIFLKCLFSR